MPFVLQVYPHGHVFRLELRCRSSSPPRSSSSLSCSLGQVSRRSAIEKQLYLFPRSCLRCFWRSTESKQTQHDNSKSACLPSHIRAHNLPLHAILCGSPLDSNDHPNIGTPRKGPRSHRSLHLLLVHLRYRLTDWTLLPPAAFNHVSMCSQLCTNQTHVDTSCCWQHHDVLSCVFIMVSPYR